MSEDLGFPDGGWIYDLSLAVDGKDLYVATDQGLWRLPQPSSQPAK